MLSRLQTLRAFGPLSRRVSTIAVCALAAAAAFAGTFGTVTPIGGMASDLALDEARGVVYVANYTANRIDAISTATGQIKTSFSVPVQPSSLSLSPDGRFLAITHLSSFKEPQTASNGLTVMDLSRNTKRSVTLASPPMGVSFLYNGKALVATATQFLLLDPTTGAAVTITTVEDLIKPKDLPVPTPTPPREIIRASMGASGDMRTVWGAIEALDAEDKILLFRYDAVEAKMYPSVWTSEPPDGPRVVSVNQDGSNVLTGWGLFHKQGYLIAQFPDALGKFAIGGHAIDSGRNTIYAQMPTSAWTRETEPVLQIVDADNLTVREKIRLKENLTGRAVLNAAKDVMYAVSDSGLMTLPVGSLNKTPRVAANLEDLVFRGQWCDRRTMVAPLEIVDPGGNATDFTITPTIPGVTVSPASGVTPARVNVSIDMNVFLANKGTASGLLEIGSAAAVNIPNPVRLLINNREPDQRGTFFNVPGRLVDLVMDPARNRFYVLRQDQNQVLVFNASNFTRTAILRTGNTPWSMAITKDGKYLVTGADNSQIAHVFDLDTLQPHGIIVFPFGHYPRWLATSSNAMLASVRVAGPIHTIDRIDFAGGVATELPSLGVWKNDIDVNTALVATPSGSSIMAASANGTVLLYEAASDTFVVARQDVDKLSGAIAALSDTVFVVDNIVMNRSLTPVRKLDTANGQSSGYAMSGGLGLRMSAPGISSPGIVQRIDFSGSASHPAVRMTEAPLLAASLSQDGTFTRSLAPAPDGKALVSLSTSGFTVLPSDYDAAAALPHIGSIASAADLSSPVAPGGLFSIGGTNLSAVNAASSEIPLPTLLGDSCMTVNDKLVPLVFVSPTQINGQIPFEVAGGASMILRTPAGVSNTFQFTIQPQAPSVFRAEYPGLKGMILTVVRAANNEPVTVANPIHPDDWITIFATGLGAASGAVTGAAGPSEPLSQVLAKPVVTLGGLNVPVSFAGLAPGQVGVYQINAKVPWKSVPEGMSVPLKIAQGSYSTTVNVRVVKP